MVSPMSKRSDRSVLVTGSNSGIGLATVVQVATLGFRAVGSVRSEAKAEVVHEAAHRAGVEVDTVLLDVTDDDACAEVMKQVRPWGLVNNAGYGGIGAVEDVGDDEARQLIETMVVAPMRLARLALPNMRSDGGGRIVNMSSVLGRTTAPLAGWYSASKHALEALSDSLRMEVASSGVKVVLVEPGGFRTGIWTEVDQAAASHPESHYSAAYRRSALGIRLSQIVMGNPAQVARVVGRALTSRVPQERYLVGLDAMALTVTQQLAPTALRDRVTRLGLGL